MCTPDDSFMVHLQLKGLNLKGLGDYACGSDNVSWKWLFLPEVLKALHVKTDTKVSAVAVGAVL
jgi:hypothetical protein